MSGPAEAAPATSCAGTYDAVADELLRSGDPAPALAALLLAELRGPDVLPVLAVARLVCVIRGDQVEPRVDVRPPPPP